MSDVGNAVGAMFGGAKNNANTVAQAAPVQNGANIYQANQLFNQGQWGINNQEQLAGALMNQGQAGMASQDQLTNALRAQAMGQGPNPAAAQLANQTGNNIASQGALMAGQRGAGANVGLMARQAGQQGAGIQQQAVGQNAVLQAQQQLAAQQQLQGLAQSQIGQNQGALNSYGQAVQGQQGNILGAIGAQNNANVSMMSNQNSANAAMAANNANNSAKAISGVGGALGGAGMGAMGGGGGSSGGAGGMAGGMDPSSMAMLAYKGGMAPDMPEHLQHMHSLYHGGYAMGGTSYKQGGNVPGTPKIQGDNPVNDVVPAKLSPGEIVIPNHITQGEDAPEKAKEFVAEQLRKHGMGNDEKSDFHAALKQAIKGRKK